jgi:hypothetical protein
MLPLGLFAEPAHWLDTHILRWRRAVESAENRRQTLGALMARPIVLRAPTIPAGKFQLVEGG